MIKLKVKISKVDMDQLAKVVLATQALKPDVPYEVFFSDQKPGRSSNQNRYLWGVVYKEISNVTGYGLEEIHEICKLKFALRTKFDFRGGDLLEIPMATRAMDTRQMTEYIEKIRHWSNESLGIFIPQPGQLSDEQLINSKDYLK